MYTCIILLQREAMAQMIESMDLKRQTQLEDQMKTDKMKK